MSAALRTALTGSVIETDPTIVALAHLDLLLSGLEQYGSKYKSREYCEAIEDAKRNVSIVRESALKTIAADLARVAQEVEN